MSMPRSVSIRSCSGLKSSPTTPTMLTGAKKRAAIEKYVAAPPSASSRRPLEVSTVSYATDPTTTIPMRFVFPRLEIFPDNRAQIGDALGWNDRAIGDDRILERAAAGAGAVALRQCHRNIFHGALREVDVGAHHREDLADIDRLHRLMPAIVIGHEHQCRVAELGFLREARLLHGGHADDVHAPASIDVRLGAAGKLRPLDA